MDIQAHLKALEEFVSSVEQLAGQSPSARVRRKQLAAVEAARRQLERTGLPIPESLSVEFEALKEGAAVEFDKEQGDKGPRAANVKLSA
ncbi:MAG: cold shock domain-containing protein [Candidatus Undinarchaeales archaeon]|nr:cold shock domain-containing protein [Candidatus Undinarchaeales archaeon]